MDHLADGAGARIVDLSQRDQYAAVELLRGTMVRYSLIAYRERSTANGLYGRLRITVAGKPVATLVVEGQYVALIPDAGGPADATVMCADDETMRKLLKGELNPFIASMRRQARLAGNRGFGTRVMLGLQVESPFAADGGREELS